MFSFILITFHADMLSNHKENLTFQILRVRNTCNNTVLCSNVIRTSGKQHLTNPKCQKPKEHNYVDPPGYLLHSPADLFDIPTKNTTKSDVATDFCPFDAFVCCLFFVLLLGMVGVEKVCQRLEGAARRIKILLNTNNNNVLC